MDRTKIYIGIDPGTHTGVAVYNPREMRLTDIRTLPLHTALRFVENYSQIPAVELVVCFEDARLRKWFGRTGREQLQGAGSIKRDSAIWEEFLTDLGIGFEKIAPRNNCTKLSAEQFRRITGYEGRVSEHGRDAAMLVFGR